ncbi:helix-turn-helix domain-containing protein [Planctomyces sp. SH-PL14]|uniref:helix-turn-helix domain-containing protein n=1 Tax=Planctomyces sp. SH-PL14 TaxID=1632864 RepID=UPI0018D3F36F
MIETHAPSISVPMVEAVSGSLSLTILHTVPGHGSGACPQLSASRRGAPALPEGPERLTTAAAARYLGLGKETLQGWRCDGRGPVFYKPARFVYYLRSDLDAWIDSRRFSSTVLAQNRNHRR